MSTRAAILVRAVVPSACPKWLFGGGEGVSLKRPASTRSSRINWSYAIGVTIVHLLSLLAFLPPDLQSAGWAWDGWSTPETHGCGSVLATLPPISASRARVLVRSLLETSLRCIYTPYFVYVP